MEQFNKVLPVTSEENTAVEADDLKDMNTPLLNKVRQKYGIFGSISLIFGAAFAFCFYKAGIGLNLFIFALVMSGLLIAVSKVLGLSVRKSTAGCHLGTVLLGLSSMLTANEALQFFNIIGMLLLLDISIINQLKGDGKWDFTKYLWNTAALGFKCLAYIFYTFIDFSSFLKKVRFLKNERAGNIIIGSIVAVPLLLIAGALLSSADLIFGSLTEGFYEFIFSADVFGILFMVIIGFVACYTIIGAAAKYPSSEINIKSKADPQIAVTITTLLFILYAIFCGIQAIYLFTGGLTVLPEGFTYAEYARKGFFELLAITVFNIILILLITNVFRESRALKSLLTAITACTYIMIASAAFRMLLYIRAYHMTFLRLFVLLFLLIDAAILAGIIISIYNKNFPLFGYCVTVVSVCYLLFSFGRPDYLIASYNISHTEQFDRSELSYLVNDLSCDAAPAVIPFLKNPGSKITNINTGRVESGSPDDILTDYTKGYYARIKRNYNLRGIRDYNYSVSTAYKNIEK